MENKIDKRKDYLMEDRAGYIKEMQRLFEILAVLREECPWDKEQDHKSLRNHILEEAHEVAEAIDNEDFDNLKEELGDVMLHIAFHSQLANEQKKFSIEDVFREENRKLIRRHPHVFGKENIKTVDKVVEKWDNIKRKESGNKPVSYILRKIPKAFSPLMRSYKIQKKAASVGFDWDDVKGALDKLKEELDEFNEALIREDAENIKEEFGDILFSLVNISRFLNINPDEALNKTNDKFIDRFEKMEALAEERNTEIEKLSLKELDSLWDEAKFMLRGEK